MCQKLLCTGDSEINKMIFAFKKLIFIVQKPVLSLEVKIISCFL